MSSLLYRASELVQEYFEVPPHQAEVVLMLTFNTDDEFRSFCKYSNESSNREDVNQLIEIIHQLLLAKGYKSVLAPFSLGEYEACIPMHTELTHSTYREMNNLVMNSYKKYAIKKYG